MGKFVETNLRSQIFLCNYFAIVAEEIGDIEGITNLVLTTHTSFQGIARFKS